MFKISSLTIIIPLYNEKKRLEYLFNSLKSLKKKELNLHVIFVDDGSIDGTFQKLKEFINKEHFQNYKLIKNTKNLGKGYSLKRGVLNSKTDWILTVDADLSVDITQVFEWMRRKYIDKSTYIYWGSRSHKFSKLKTNIFRVYLGHIFKFIIRLFFNIKNCDTQCGFKLYNKRVKKVFSKLKIKGFSHDVEIYLISKKFNYNIKFLPVKWTHKKNSKINFLSLIKMFLELIVLKIKYF